MSTWVRGVGKTMMLNYLRDQREDFELFLEYAVLQEGPPEGLAGLKRLFWSALRYVAEHGTPTAEAVKEALKG